MAIPLRNGNEPSRVKLAGLMMTTDDLRALLALVGEPHYRIAAAAQLSPVRLSAILNGHVRITEHVAVRILAAASAAACRRVELGILPPPSIRRAARAAVEEMLSDPTHPNYEILKQEYERHMRGDQ